MGRCPRAPPSPLPIHTPLPPLPSLLNTYIVEDSPVIREDLIATLEELAPVRVVGTAEDEATALRWLAEPGRARLDLLIVDIFLKAGSGLGVLRAAQALPRRFGLVVLSNYTAPGMRRTCLALGADRVFDKSTEIDALLTYCERLGAGGFGGSGGSGGAAAGLPA